MPPHCVVGRLDCMKDVTLILQRIEQGQAQGTKELFPLVYAELRRIRPHDWNREAKLGKVTATAVEEFYKAKE